MEVEVAVCPSKICSTRPQVIAQKFAGVADAVFFTYQTLNRLGLVAEQRVELGTAPLL